MGSLSKSPRNFSPHVLLAEDDDLTLRVVEQLLKQCNYKVTVARNGQEALDVLQRNESEMIDLILTDIMMPEVDGMDLVCEVNKCKEWSHLPVIVMSSEQSQEAICKAFHIGAADYLIKPIRKNEVATLWHHIWRKVMAAGGQQGLAAEWINANYRQEMLPTASLDAAAVQHGGSTDTLSGSQVDARGLEVQSSLAPPRKRQRLFPQGADYCAAQGVNSAESPQHSLATSGSAMAPADTNLKFAESEASDSGASEDDHLQSSIYQPWAAEAVQVSFVRPHEAPDLGSTGGVARLQRNALPRILSAPSILAVERLHCAQVLNTGAATVDSRKRLLETGASCREAACRGRSSDGSSASELTAQQVGMVASAAGPFGATFPLKGCESLGVNSCMVVSVDLEIAPLDLTPWPSASSLPGIKTQPGNAAPVDSLSKKQADDAAAALCFLARSFMAVVPRPCMRGTLDTSMLSAKEQQNVKAKGPIEGGPAATPNIVLGAPNVVVAPKQQQHEQQQHQHSFCRALKVATDLHMEMLTTGNPATWAANRKAALEKLREKKKLRNFDKKVRYESRRRLAESRPRIRGQFVKASVVAAAANAATAQIGC